MLGPDVTSASASLQAGVTAVSVVTNYAQASLTAVPRVSQPPDWFAPIAKDLLTAQGHAQGWIKTICPAVSSGLPKGIASFNHLFQSSARQIIAAQDAILAAGGTPTAAQRAQVGSLIDALATALAAQQSSLAVIGENFLQSTQLGPCTAIVMIDMNISLLIGGVNADPTVVTLVLAQAIVQNQLTNAPAAEQAVQAIVDFWGTLAAKTKAVATDLSNAADNQYLTILSQIDIKVAQTQWQQLADFAATLNHPANHPASG